MLESWIIDALRREEREREERERQQPQLEIPQPEWLPRPTAEKVERRGVVILQSL